MNKRVYGVLGVSAIMANWNADFSGFPKTTSDGSIFGSDKALKYPIKKMWENAGEKVLYIKSMKFSPDKKETSLIPRTIKERYEQIFNVEDLSKCKDNKEVLTNLFQAIDVKNFGATFAESKSKKNIPITGAVQIGQGFNKYEDSTVEEQQILSPFRDGSKDSEKNEEAKNTTIGTKIVSKEAHYVYPFSINPLAYKEPVELGVTEGYTEEDYKKFKDAAKCAVTSYATNAKSGCENELAIFIETDPQLYLPNLSEYVTFQKGEKNIFTLEFSDLLEEVSERVHSVEIYYNPYTTQVKHQIKEAKMFNIFTNKEV